MTIFSIIQLISKRNIWSINYKLDSNMCSKGFCFGFSKDLQQKFHDFEKDVHKSIKKVEKIAFVPK